MVGLVSYDSSDEDEEIQEAPQAQVRALKANLQQKRTRVTNKILDFLSSRKQTGHNNTRQLE